MEIAINYHMNCTKLLESGSSAPKLSKWQMQWHIWRYEDINNTSNMPLLTGTESLKLWTSQIGEAKWKSCINGMHMATSVRLKCSKSQQVYWNIGWSYQDIENTDNMPLVTTTETVNRISRWNRVKETYLVPVLLPCALINALFLSCSAVSTMNLAHSASFAATCLASMAWANSLPKSHTSSRERYWNSSPSLSESSWSPC